MSNTTIKVIAKTQKIIVNAATLIYGSGSTPSSPPPGPTELEEGGYDYLQNSTPAPVSPTVGETWFAPDTGNTFLFYPSSWLLIGTKNIDGGTATTF